MFYKLNWPATIDRVNIIHFVVGRTSNLHIDTLARSHSPLEPHSSPLPRPFLPSLLLHPPLDTQRHSPYIPSTVPIRGSSDFLSESVPCCSPDDPPPPRSSANCSPNRSLLRAHRGINQNGKYCDGETSNDWFQNA